MHTLNNYTWIGALACGAFAAFCLFRIWTSLARGEAAVDFHFLLAFLSGRDANTTSEGESISFPRESFPLMFWGVVVVWCILAAAAVFITVAILRNGIH